MLSIIKPIGIDQVSDRYKDLFPDSYVTHANLCALLALFLLGLSSLSEIVKACGWAASVSELSRAVNDFQVYDEDPEEKPLKTNRFMRRLRNSILKKFPDMKPEDFAYIVDDTGNPKYGLNHPGVGVWANSSGSKYRGQKILVIALVNIKTRTAYPIAYSFLLKKDDNDKEKEHETGHQAAVRLLKEILNSGFPKLTLIADSWFSTNNMIKEVVGCVVTYVTELKMNRNLRLDIKQKVGFKKAEELFVKKDKIKTDTKKKHKPKNDKDVNIKYFSEIDIIYLKDSLIPLKSVALYNKCKDKKPFAVYVTTDLTKSGEWIWEMSRARWAIETMFRDLKQNLSFGCMPSECKEGSDLSVCLPFLLYVTLQLEQPEFWGTKITRSVTLGTIVHHVRELNLTKALDIISKNPKHKNVVKLRGRRDIDRINKKPVDKPSGRIAV